MKADPAEVEAGLPPSSQWTRRCACGHPALLHQLDAHHPGTCTAHGCPCARPRPAYRLTRGPAV